MTDEELAQAIGAKAKEFNALCDEASERRLTVDITPYRTRTNVIGADVIGSRVTVDELQGITVSVHRTTRLDLPGGIHDNGD